MHGEGIFTWKDNRKYIGSYVNDKKEGYGEFTWPSGKVYKGNWKDGKQDGDGELFNTQTGEKLSGSWKRGSRLSSGI